MNLDKTRNRFIPGVLGGCAGRDAARHHRRHYVHPLIESRCRAAYAYPEEELVNVGSAD